MYNCLYRLLEENKQEEEQQFFQKTFIGQILGVTSSGQFCHIGDYGSMLFLGIGVDLNNSNFLNSF